jgi:hypothetical protein
MFFLLAKLMNAIAHSLDTVVSADDLDSLNMMLTQAMSQQKIHELIKGDGLKSICHSIVLLAKTSEPIQRLKAAGMLERLAAVARGERENIPRELVTLLLSDVPPPIDLLADDKEKFYSAEATRYADGIWVTGFCVRESLAIENADIARKALLDILLERQGTFADWLKLIRENASILDSIGNAESRLKKVRRIVTQMVAVAREYQGDLGQFWGAELRELSKTLLKRYENYDNEVLFDVLSGFHNLLARAIELRFSVALDQESYSVLDELKRRTGSLIWGQFLSASREVLTIRRCLLESALVLARQARSDSAILNALLCMYSSKPQATAAMRRHFELAHDLDPEIREWWISCGTNLTSEKEVQQAIGNTEDQQIGALLIEVESNQEPMEKLLRVVVPYLEISDPVMASTVKKAANSYSAAAQIARRLARIRHLSKTELKNSIVEYNPLEHEMVGGHRQGIRKVKVVRDGIRKNFSGKIKTLVKPWVEKSE